MSRLYDRLLRGCPPFRPAELLAGTAFEERLGQLCGEVEPRLAEAMTPAQLGRWFLRTAHPTGRRRLDLELFRGAPVIAVDNVGDYCEGLSKESNLADLVATVAPPFERFFVECAPTSGRTGSFSLHSWGFACAGADLCSAEWAAKVPDRRLSVVAPAFSGQKVEIPAVMAEVPVRWVLQLILVLEARKGSPCGPVAEWNFPLDDEGHLIGRGDGAVMGHRRTGGPGAAHQPAVQPAAGGGFRLHGPAGAAVGVVDALPQRRHDGGEPGGAEDQERTAAQPGAAGALPRARHRAHAADPRVRGPGATTGPGGCPAHLPGPLQDLHGGGSPVRQAHTGTYFWHEQARGSAKRGAVATDYRIVLDEPDE